MGKRSKKIQAPDGGLTMVNMKRFTTRKSRDEFIERIGKRLHHFKWDENLDEWIVEYYRDTKRNRRMYGFKEHTPHFRVKEEYYR